MDGANKYRIQVYSTEQQIVLDSVVTLPRLVYPLGGGSYRWRVRGENDAYTSAYSYSASFAMVETNDLTTQQVLLVNPSNAVYTNAQTMTFNWQGLKAAETYDFELVNVTSGNIVVNQQTGLTGNTVTLNGAAISQEAEYQWKVRALNSSSTTAFATRTFYLDKTNPGQPANIAPAANTVFDADQELNFSWSIPVDTGAIQSALTYEIEFSNDISFSAIVLTATPGTNAFQHAFAVAGIYYWKVRTKDAAGNTGNYSTAFKLTIE
jgi:hypothetical protein